MKDTNSNPLQSNNTIHENFEDTPPPLVNQLIDPSKVTKGSIDKIKLINKFIY